MTQYENSKQAMANIYAIEDAKDIFEAIGALNDENDPVLGTSTDNDTFNPADLLSVTPAQNDPSAFNGAFDTPAEPSEEDQRFVVDRFAEELSKVKKDTVNLNDIAPIATLIQDEVGTKMNVSDYLEKMMLGAHERLGSQNVSEAQPTGADANADAAAAAAPEAPVGALGDMGTPALDAAPGGIAPEPGLETNPGDDLGLGAIPDAPSDDLGTLDAEPAPEAGAGTEDTAAGDDLGLDGITDDASGLDGLGDLGSEEAPAEGDAGTDDIFSDGGLDGLSDDTLDDGAAADDTAGEPAVEDAPATDDTLTDDKPAEDEPAIEDTDEKKDDIDFEAEMAEDRAILESLHAQYIEDMARKKIKSLTEAFVLKQKQKSKKAQLESIIDNFGKKNSEAMIESVAAKKRSELAAKLESIIMEQKQAGTVETDGEVEAPVDEDKATAPTENVQADEECQKKVKTECAAKLESIINNFAASEEGAADRSRLLAKLESISSTYHANEKKAAQLESQKRLSAKLESIVQNFKKPVAGNSPAKSSLERKLDSIVASVK